MIRAWANRDGEMTQYVYRFGGGVSEGKAGDKNLLGGKGANLAEMASIGLPVPPGLTISTEMCIRSEEHTSELQSLMRISYAVFCLKKQTKWKSSRTASHYNNTNLITP